MIKIESEADKVAMWFLIALGLVNVFYFSYGLGYGLATTVLGY